MSDPPPPLPKFFANNVLTKNDIENDILSNCQWINNKSVDFYKMEHCPYMREGKGSILGTSELTKLLKINIFVSLCDNSSHKRTGKQKI